MTLDDLTATHHPALLVACWRELGTLDVQSPKITGVFGVEDFDNENNKVGMLEVECQSSGRRVELHGSRMIPLIHGYHPSGPNGGIKDSARPYHIAGAKGSLGMPNLSLIRLQPPTAPVRLLLSQPGAIASLFGMAALFAITASSLLTGAAKDLAQWMVAVLLAGHAVEAAFALYVCLIELKLSWRAAGEWAAVVGVVGIFCTLQLIKLRPRSKAVEKTD